MFSIVATETSVLTFISVPGLAYREDWFFLQLALGYILGRILVSVLLLPRYMEGDVVSIYEIVGRRFGPGMQKTPLEGAGSRGKPRRAWWLQGNRRQRFRQGRLRLSKPGAVPDGSRLFGEGELIFIRGLAPSHALPDDARAAAAYD